MVHLYTSMPILLVAVVNRDNERSSANKLLRPHTHLYAKDEVYLSVLGQSFHLFH